MVRVHAGPQGPCGREKSKKTCSIHALTQDHGGLAQLARAPALQAGGHRFESDILHSKGDRNDELQNGKTEGFPGDLMKMRTRWVEELATAILRV